VYDGLNPVLMLPVCWDGEYWNVADIWLHDVLWGWLRYIVGEGRWLSVHRLVCYVVEKFVSKRIPSSSFCFLCCMVLVVVWLGLHFCIHIYCLACVVHMLRLGYLFWCILCVCDVIFLLISSLANIWIITGFAF